MKQVIKKNKSKSVVIGRLVMKYRNPLLIGDAYSEYDLSGAEKLTLEDFKLEFNSTKDAVEKFTGRTLWDA
jgi:hypothetical protein